MILIVIILSQSLFHKSLVQQNPGSCGPSPVTSPVSYKSSHKRFDFDMVEAAKKEQERKVTVEGGTLSLGFGTVLFSQILKMVAPTMKPTESTAAV